MRAPRQVRKYSIFPPEIQISPHSLLPILLINNKSKESIKTKEKRRERRKEKMRYIAIPLVVLMALTFGCAQMVVQGKPIDRAKMNQLVPGQTKTEKVVEVFGKPDSVEKIASGGEKYVYQYFQLRPRIFKVDEVVKERLDIIIKDNMVQRYDLSAEGVQEIPRETTQATK